MDVFCKGFCKTFYIFIGGLFCVLSMIILPLKMTGVSYYVARIILFLIFLIPLLHGTGYFWYLTDNIADRKEDVILSNVYNGNRIVKEIIELPEINLFKFVWRGVASIVVTLMLYIPIILLFVYSVSSMEFIAKFWGWTPFQALLFYVFLIVLISILLPALLWNYARRNSVFAVWNIFVAVDIIGNNTGRYAKNALLFFLYAFIYTSIMKFISNMIGLNFLSGSSAGGTNILTITGPDVLVPLLILMVINYIAGMYWLFVTAYLLGTITPKTDY